MIKPLKYDRQLKIELEIGWDPRAMVAAPQKMEKMYEIQRNIPIFLISLSFPHCIYNFRWFSKLDAFANILML